MVAKDCSVRGALSAFIVVVALAVWCAQLRLADASGSPRPPPVAGSAWVGEPGNPARLEVSKSLLCAGIGRRCTSFKKCCNPTDRCFEHPKAKLDWQKWCVPAAGFNERAEKAKTSPFGDGKYYSY